MCQVEFDVVWFYIVSHVALGVSLHYNWQFIVCRVFYTEKNKFVGKLHEWNFYFTTKHNLYQDRTYNTLLTISSQPDRHSDGTETQWIFL